MEPPHLSECLRVRPRRDCIGLQPLPPILVSSGSQPAAQLGRPATTRSRWAKTGCEGRSSQEKRKSCSDWALIVQLVRGLDCQIQSTLHLNVPASSGILCMSEGAPLGCCLQALDSLGDVCFHSGSSAFMRCPSECCPYLGMFDQSQAEVFARRARC